MEVEDVQVALPVGHCKQTPLFKKYPLTHPVATVADVHVVAPVEQALHVTPEVKYPVDEQVATHDEVVL